MTQQGDPNVDVLCYVEDPGAVNFLGDIPQALAATGSVVRILAAGSASARLAPKVAPWVVPIDASDEPQTVLGSFTPRLILVGTAENRDSLGLRLIPAARSAGIPTVGLVDSAVHADRVFSGRTEDKFAFAPDNILIPDEWSAERFRTAGFEAAHLHVVGHPLYDEVRSRGRAFASLDPRVKRDALFPGAGPGQKILLFLAEPIISLRPELSVSNERYTLTGRGDTDNRTRIVLEETLDAAQRNPEDFYFVLRLHPKNSIAEFEAYTDEIDQVSAAESAHETVFFADLVIGMTTNLILESALLGSRTLSVLPLAEQSEWLPNLRDGSTRFVSTRDDLDSALAWMLDPSVPVSPMNLPTGATPRIVAYLRSVMRSN